MGNILKTFGSILKKIIQMITPQSNATRYDIIFDQYFSPSIKDYETSFRHEWTQLKVNITGPEQVGPFDLEKEVKIRTFVTPFYPRISCYHCK